MSFIVYRKATHTHDILNSNRHMITFHLIFLIALFAWPLLQHPAVAVCVCALCNNWINIKDNVNGTWLWCRFCLLIANTTSTWYGSTIQQRQQHQSHSAEPWNVYIFHLVLSRLSAAYDYFGSVRTLWPHAHRTHRRRSHTAFGSHCFIWLTAWRSPQSYCYDDGYRISWIDNRTTAFFWSEFWFMLCARPIYNITFINKFIWLRRSVDMA